MEEELMRGKRKISSKDFQYTVDENLSLETEQAETMLPTEEDTSHQDKKPSIDGSNNITINIELTHQCDTDNTDVDISCNGVQQPIESTRISSLSLSNTNNSSTSDLTYLDSSNFKSMMVNSILEDDSNCRKEVSIISKLVNLIFSIYSDWNIICIHGTDMDISKTSVNGADQILMRAVCNMKTVKVLTSTLCSVHEAIGLQDLKLLSNAFKKDVNDALSYIKNTLIQTNTLNISFTINFKHIIIRMLRLAGGLSLASVDHIKMDSDDLYLDDDVKGELFVYFLKQQNRFLMTMFDEALCTIDNGIEEMKPFQLSSSHEMSEDLVDGIMNVLTSMSTLLHQCTDFMNIYVDTTVQYPGQYFTKECYLLREILTGVVDYNEYIKTFITKSKQVAENCDYLEEFLDVPVILADTTKCICNSASELVSYISCMKKFDVETNDVLTEALRKFLFSGKTVRVGIAMVVQEVEKELNLQEDLSIMPIIEADAPFVKEASLCPLNTSMIDGSLLNTKLQGKFKNLSRSSILSDQYVSRYMGN